jgi:hypothetical protein
VILSTPTPVFVNSSGLGWVTTVTSQNEFAVTAIVAVFAYYLLAWVVFGWGRQIGTVVPLYDPPRHLSPAMLRYIWKENFDDRTFWAGVLSLVAKGLATLHSGNGAALIRATPLANKQDKLPDEEEILLEKFVRGHTRKDVPIDMLSSRTALAVRDRAEALRRDAVGRWFTDTRTFVIVGVLLSAGALCLVAGPRYKDQWGALIYGLVIMGPGAFYLFFISQRVWDMLRAARQHCDFAVLRREALLLTMLLPCLAAIISGGVIVGGTFGWHAVAAALFLAAMNAFFFAWIRTPTQEGKQLLTEIEGFRLFLKSVEQLPMQRTEEPTDHAGIYEKYLPYAVALEVEQAWGDRFLALASTYHEHAGVGAEAFYLGMWNGKPLEILYKPEGPRTRSI